MSCDDTIRAIPTNIITGFLGVGKTSAIIKLMKHKPNNERWAVLVNEFGEIGIDSCLIQGQQSDKQIFIREVAGGCMCCTAGLSMQIALNQLLKKAKPDRLLIEPTGLGHPKEVLQVLLSDHYRSIISLQKILTLVDARKLSDPRYTEHDTFNQQISIADTVVGSKSDLYADGDKQLLADYIDTNHSSEIKLIFAEHGNMSVTEFEGATRAAAEFSQHHFHHHSNLSLTAAELPLPECGIIKTNSEGEGFKSMGWRFAPDKVFKRQRLVPFVLGLNVERLKAVFITDDGIYGYNLTSDGITVIEFDDCFESRIELIGVDFDDSIEEQLMACIED